MRGSLQKAPTKKGLKKGESAWRIVLSLGRGPNGKYKQNWQTFYGTKKQAQQKLRDLVGEVYHGEFVEPTTITVAAYFNDWLETVIKPRLTLNTYESYSNTVSKYFIPAFGHLALQQLHPMHVERYYAESKLSPASLAVHHGILSSALKAAVRKGMLRRNAASKVANKPMRPSGGADLLDNVWSIDEARRFLAYVKEHCITQEQVLFALALDSGARKAELLALRWSDVVDGKLKIERQLIRCKQGVPEFTPPKRGGIRSLELSDETLARLQQHKRDQAQLKMEDRLRYKDHGLIFAQTRELLSGKSPLLGAPLHRLLINKHLAKLCRAAGVKQITPHGLRHTCATLLLAAQVPAHVVQRRLGHKKVEMTLNLYAHVLPSMQADAAAKLAAMLHSA